MKAALPLKNAVFSKEKKKGQAANTGWRGLLRGLREAQSRMSFIFAKAVIDLFFLINSSHLRDLER